MINAPQRRLGVPAIGLAAWHCLSLNPRGGAGPLEEVLSLVVFVVLFVGGLADFDIERRIHRKLDRLLYKKAASTAAIGYAILPLRRSSSMLDHWRDSDTTRSA